MHVVELLRNPSSSPDARQRRRVLVRAIVGLAVVGGALSGAEPTGLSWLDPVLTGIFAGAVTFAASRARRWSWASASGLALIGATPSTVMFLVALVVFGAAVAVSWLDMRSRVIGALLGAATTLILLNLPAWGPFGLQSAIAAVGAAMLVGSGWPRLRVSTKRGALVITLALGVVGLVISALSGISALRVRSDLEDGIRAARDGISAAREGDTERAADLFDQAGKMLKGAADDLNAPWVKAAAAVPVVGQHAQALRVLTNDAVELTRTGARSARDADVETLRVQDGTLDLASVEAMRDPLERVDEALAQTQRHLEEVDSSWLIGPVHDEVDRLRTQVDKATGSARTASVGIDAAPRLLGGDGPRRYLLMFTTPSEARGSGFMGNWGVLEADQGHLELTEFGRTSELNASGDPAAKRITGPADYLARYERFEPAQEWRNVNMSPDFPSVARVARELFAQSDGGSIDGVIAIDPEGIAALLRLTGPVTIPGRAEPLTAENAAEFLLRGQYQQFGSLEGRVDFLEEAARAVTERLTHSSLPGPRTLGKALRPAAQGGHLLLYSFDPQAQRLFERLHLSGRLAPDEGDYAGLVTQNASGNKIELFLHRSLRYDVRIDPSDGTAHATADITLENRAPSSGEPGIVIGSPVPGITPGTNRMIVSFYSTLGVTSATLDGQATELGAQVERGLNVFTRALTLAPGQTAQLHLELQGPAGFVDDDGENAIQLTLGHQTMPNPDRVDVSLQVTNGWSLTPQRPLRTTSSNTVSWSKELRARTELRARLDE